MRGILERISATDLVGSGGTGPGADAPVCAVSVVIGAGEVAGDTTYQRCLAGGVHVADGAADGVA